MTKNKLRYSLFGSAIYEGCKDCEKRHEGFHSSCEDYLKATLLIDLLRAEFIKEQDLREDVRSYEIKRTRKKAKNKHPTTRYGAFRKRR